MVRIFMRDKIIIIMNSVRCPSKTMHGMNMKLLPVERFIAAIAHVHINVVKVRRRTETTFFFLFFLF